MKIILYIIHECDKTVVGARIGVLIIVDEAQQNRLSQVGVSISNVNTNDRKDLSPLLKIKSDV